GALDLVVGVESAQHVARGHLAATDRSQHVLDGGSSQPRQRSLEIVVAVDATGALEGTLDKLAPEASILAPDRNARGTPDRRTRLAGNHERLPGCRWGLVFRREHLNLVAIAQFRDERGKTAVDLAAHHAVPELGMDRIGKIDWRRAAWQRNQPALWGEAED